MDEDNFLNVLFQDNDNFTDCHHEEFIGMWPTSNSSKNLLKGIKRLKKFKPALLDLLKVVIEFCRTFNCPYFIVGGTALAVYRENGSMIKHDHDIDIGIMESDLHRFYENREFFDSSKYQISGWDRCFDKHTHQELSFDGFSSKSIKLCFTYDYLKQLFKNPPSPCDIHLDIFTYSSHPENPKIYLRINWFMPRLYDWRRKLFKRSSLFPLRKYIFEGIDVYGPCDLYDFLKTEYGYLERDAEYDAETQLYIKMSSSKFADLPNKLKEILS